MSRPNGRSMLLLHGTLLIYAVVSVFAKLAGLRLAAQDAGMTLAFLAAEAAEVVLPIIIQAAAGDKADERVRFRRFCLREPL